MSSVQQSLNLQNAALIQQIQILHERVANLQDSQDSITSSMPPSTIPQPQPAQSIPSFAVNIPDPVTTTSCSSTTLDPNANRSDVEFRLPAIKESILQNIRAGKYIDLTKLTPRAALATGEGFQMVMGRDSISGDPAVNVVPRSFKSDFKSFREWLAAFLIHAQAYLRCFPARAGGVMAYIERITMYASRYPLENWVAYDKLFRQALPSSQLLRWGVEDKALFDLCLAGYRLPSASTFTSSSRSTCFRCGSEGHFAASCPQHGSSATSATATPQASTSNFQLPFHAPQRGPATQQPQAFGATRPFRPPRPSSFSFTSNVCRQFRDTGNCSRIKCAYAHVCTTCGGRHHAGSCTFRSRP